MLYKVALYPTEEGFSVSVPELPGCWSEGETEEEALRNIEDAVREYLEVASRVSPSGKGRFRGEGPTRAG
jgi:predicted RNase H-like HicB family nuclease